MAYVWFVAFVWALWEWMREDQAHATTARSYLKRCCDLLSENVELRTEITRLRRQLIRPVDSPASVVADSLQARLERTRRAGMARTRAEIQALPETGGDAS